MKNIIFAKKRTMKYIYFLIGILCFLPFVSAPMALFCGIFFSFFNIEKPFEFKKYSSKILQYSVVLMGFGMNLQQVIETSSKGILLTACSVVLVFFAGLILGRIFKVDKTTSILISSGTAICGGSAIAAVSPIVKAKDSQISFSLTVVFVLNAIALFVFPLIGEYFNMSQENFGYWSAIAIHDTSSVVGAGAIYGQEALETATTVKLTRTLWIIPLSFLVMFVMKKDNNTKTKIKIPWFILYFVIAILITALLPSLKPAYEVVSYIGKRGMVLALFMIGCGFSFADLKQVGLRPFLLGLVLWIIISVSTFVFFI